MLYSGSWAFTLPALLAGMLGVFVVMGALAAAVLLLNRFTGGRGGR